MDIIMVLFCLFGHENTRRKGQFKKARGKFCDNIRTQWTGFIHQRTGFNHQETGFIRCGDEASPPKIETSPPADEASSIGPIYIYIFFLSLFSQRFCFVCSESFTIGISIRNYFSGSLFWFTEQFLWVGLFIIKFLERIPLQIRTFVYAV